MDEETDNGSSVESAQEMVAAGAVSPEKIAPAKPSPGRLMVAGRPIRGIVPGNLADVAKLAAVIAESGLAPYGLKSVQQVAVAILYGLEIGLPPMQALQSIAVINGRPTIYGDAGIALVENSGQLEAFEEHYSGTFPEDGFTSHTTVKRIGKAARTEEFSIADAKYAKLWNKKGGQNNDKDTPWVTYPKRMLRWRSRVVFRDVFPDILRGLRFTEEARDDTTLPDEPAMLPSPESMIEKLAGNGNGTGGFDRDQVEAEANGHKPEDETQDPQPASETARAELFRLLGIAKTAKEVDAAAEAFFARIDSEPITAQQRTEAEMDINARRTELAPKPKKAGPKPGSAAKDLL